MMSIHQKYDEVTCVIDDTVHKLLVIAIYTELKFYDATTHLVCYVPDYISINSSFKLQRHHMKQFEFDEKFLSERAVYVSPDRVTSVEKHIPGAKCSKCGIYVQYVEEPFTCYDCRQDPYR